MLDKIVNWHIWQQLWSLTPCISDTSILSFSRHLYTCTVNRLIYLCLSVLLCVIVSYCIDVIVL